MTDHMEAAIEAGADAARWTGPKLYKAAVNPMPVYIARDVINAALPHLREMIAAEVEALDHDPQTARTLIHSGYSVEYLGGYTQALTKAAKTIREGTP